MKLLSSNHAERKSSAGLRVLDLCTGTGCIPLLFHHDYYSNSSNRRVNLSLVGVDISPEAISLARENKAVQLHYQQLLFKDGSARQQALESMAFLRGSVLRNEAFIDPHNPFPVLRALQENAQSSVTPTFDILISNPPYISSSDYIHTTSRSVRKFEPRLALVPPNSKATTHDGDLFYPHLLHLAEQVEAQVVLFEVANLEQAKRVAAMAVAEDIWDGVMIWRDDPAGHSRSPTELSVGSTTVGILGRGHGRFVVAHRGNGNGWLGKENRS